MQGKFTPDGKQYAATSTDDQFRLFDVASGQSIPSAMQKKGRIWGFVFDGSGKYLATHAVDEKAVILWEMVGDKQLHTIAMPEGMTLSNLVFSPDGKRLYAAAADKKWLYRCFIWNTATGEKGSGTFLYRR